MNSHNALVLLLMMESVRSVQVDHFYFRSHKSGGAVSGVIFFFVICIGLIATCVYLVNRCRRRNQVNYPPPPPPPPLPVYPQPPVYYPNRYPSLQTSNPYQNFSNGNFSSSPVYASPNIRQNVPIQDDVVRAVQGNYTPNTGQWEGLSFYSSRWLKESCGCCNSYAHFNGQQPTIVLGCSEHHAFHLACLNQFKSNATKQKAYRGMICPACTEPVSNKVRLFCVLCKQKSVQVNLSDFTDSSGLLNATNLLSRYGEYCPECRSL